MMMTSAMVLEVEDLDPKIQLPPSAWREQHPAMKKELPPQKAHIFDVMQMLQIRGRSWESVEDHLGFQLGYVPMAVLGSLIPPSIC